MELKESPNIRFAVEINSLYDTQFWGLPDFLYFADPSKLKPSTFWGRALDLLVELGFSGFEMTFGAGSAQSALEAYGSASAFRRDLDCHGLAVASGFYSGFFDNKPASADYTNRWRTPERGNEIMKEVCTYLNFLAECGCGCMTIGLPIRKALGERDPYFADADYMKHLADFMNRIGYEAAQRGMRLAMHPESSSVFWLPRDIRLLLDFTDPYYVDFCPDTAHIRSSGADPATLVRQYAERMSIFHWKDCSKEIPMSLSTEGIIFQNHQPYMTTVGRGLVDGKAWAEMLKDIHYQGWAIMEIPAAPEFGEIKFATTYLKEKILPIYC